MSATQSPHTPAPGRRPALRDAGWLLAYGLGGLMRLVRARLAFTRFEARHIRQRNDHSLQMNGAGETNADPALVARIAYVIPRISARVPWRSDCVIQAMAAQDWLAEHGLESEIRIGVERPADGKFGAHAWLVHREMIVTGGDIAKYDVLLESDRQKRAGS